MLEPDSTVRVPSPEGAPADFGPDALQILDREHWGLLAARSLVYTEAMSRASMFIAALSGAVVALALVAQATDFGAGFVAFALVLLPVVYFLGVVTIARLAQVNHREQALGAGNESDSERIPPTRARARAVLRHESVRRRGWCPHDISGAHRALRRLQPFIAVPGVIAVIDSVVAGAAGGIAGLGLDLGVVAALALGAAFFVLSILFFALWARTQIGNVSTGLRPLFPTPGA